MTIQRPTIAVAALTAAIQAVTVVVATVVVVMEAAVATRYGMLLSSLMSH